MYRRIAYWHNLGKLFALPNEWKGPPQSFDCKNREKRKERELDHNFFLTPIFSHRERILSLCIFYFSLAPHLQFYLTVFAVSQFPGFRGPHCRSPVVSCKYISLDLIPDRTPRTFLLPTYLNTKGSNIHSDVTKINNLGPEGPVTVETDRQR